jgi:hypothetical protein
LACYDSALGLDHLVTDVINNPQAVAAIVAALFALIGGVGGPVVALIIGRKQAARQPDLCQRGYANRKDGGIS